MLEIEGNSLSAKNEFLILYNLNVSKFYKTVERKKKMKTEIETRIFFDFV
jgi:hypothetical protein